MGYMLHTVPAVQDMNTSRKLSKSGGHEHRLQFTQCLTYAIKAHATNVINAIQFLQGLA